MNLALFPFRAAGSLIKATDDTAPLVQDVSISSHSGRINIRFSQSIQEIRDFSPLVLAVGMAFAETQLDKNEEVTIDHSMIIFLSLSLSRLWKHSWMLSSVTSGATVRTLRQRKRNAGRSFVNRRE